MTHISPDQIYDKFRAEAKEENGNFYFVKAYDEKLYQMLLEAERKAKTDLGSSGNKLRNTLERFMRSAMPDRYLNEVYLTNARRRNLNHSNSADIFDYQKVFGQHREIGVDEKLFGNVRVATNAFDHEKADRYSNLKPRTYVTLCNAFGDMQRMLLGYYKKLDPSKLGRSTRAYDKDAQPYEDKMVCSIIDTHDSTACEKQVLCSRQDAIDKNRKFYYLLRIYHAEDISEGTFRDEKVLGNLWGNSLGGIPNIVRYSPIHVEYNGEDPKNEKKYIVSYEFGAYKPYPLHERILEQLLEKQKTMLMHDIAAGVQVLHSSGIFHRNLQPNSVFVFFDRGSDLVQAKLVGFEYSKIDGDNATVFASVAKLQQEDPSSFFSMSMKMGLKNKQIGRQLDWAKEDIYSLGALYYFILTAKQLPGIVKQSDLDAVKDLEFRQIISKMLSQNVEDRPQIGDVMAFIEPKYKELVVRTI